MSIIRITQASEGIEHYFETGQKLGREQSRDELDQRVHLSGSIDAFRVANQYCLDHKKWDNNYWHITNSFAIDNQDVSDEILRHIVDDMLAYYYPDYDKDNLVHAAEAHRPKIQSLVDETTGEVRQRLLHLHLAVSKLDTATGNQVRMQPFSYGADKAFQSLLAEKYGLVDPADRRRDIAISKKDIISRWNNEPTAKQTKVADMRKAFAEVLADASSIDEAVGLLNQLDTVASVSFKQQKSGNKYLQVETTAGSKNINLRGKGFEDLERIYYTADELAKREQAGKFKPVDERTNQERVDEHKAWWLEQQSKRKKPSVDNDKRQKRLEKHFTERLKEARIYYVIYSHNIKEETIAGYRIWEKNNVKYLFNNELGIKIYDRPDRITLTIPDDADKRREAVRLMLEMAKAKGWKLESLVLTGGDAFKDEVREQVRLLNEEKRNLVLTDAEALMVKPAESALKQPVSTLNVVDDQLRVLSDKKAVALNKDEIAALKENLDARAVINLAVTKYNLIGSHFTVTDDNKISDDRTKAKPKSVIDFITKTCNVSFKEALPILQDLYDQQKEIEPMNLSVCKGAHKHGLTGWEAFEAKTFGELERAVKTYPYAAFADLTDGYRKGENVVRLGNVMIFDIDNDPDAPQMSIEQARSVLKDTTYMIVTSRSHQIEKDGKPAVDRYRILVPLTEPLSTHKDLYRLQAVKLAEDIGLREYTDHKALKDVARQYYQSPESALVLVNNTKQAYSSADAIQFGTDELWRLEQVKIDAKQAIQARIMPSVMTDYVTSDYPMMIDVNKMNLLPLDEIYQDYTGNKLEREGSYLMGKGVTAGTSQSRQSFTVWEDGGDWLWHDLKSGESGNVLTFMREAAGMNAYQAAVELSNKYGVELLIDNHAYYADIVAMALDTAINDKTLEQAIKDATGATYVKFDTNGIKIANKEFSFEQLGIADKGEVISTLKANRGRGSRDNELDR